MVRRACKLRRVWPILAILAFASGAGCFGRGIIPRQYVLAVITAPPRGAPPAGSRDVVVGVGPLELPEYLRRPQIVTRERDNQLRVSAADRWAGDLEAASARVLAQNLAALIPSRNVSAFPWMSPAALDYRVPVRIGSFERDVDGKVHLRAHWALLAGEQGAVVTARVSDIATPVRGDDAGAIVTAMSVALGDLSREIATEIRQAASRRRH